MTRRGFVCLEAVATAVGFAGRTPLVVPVHRVMDRRAQGTPQIRRFWSSIWPEAVRDFGRCGIQFQTSDERGEIRLSPSGRPIFAGVKRGVLNLVITDRIPSDWDNGRALSGVTTLYEGYHLCVIALSYAHGHQMPFVSLNTCVHELLHALLGDIYVSRPQWYQSNEREFRIDWDATLLWMFGDGAAIRKSAEAYVARLRSGAAAAS